MRTLREVTPAGQCRNVGLLSLNTVPKSCTARRFPIVPCRVGIYADCVQRQHGGVSSRPVGSAFMPTTCTTSTAVSHHALSGRHSCRPHAPPARRYPITLCRVGIHAGHMHHQHGGIPSRPVGSAFMPTLPPIRLCQSAIAYSQIIPFHDRRPPRLPLQWTLNFPRRRLRS